ncbi:DNA polymerase III subunit alpha [Granulicatella elegans]|uniref:DNA polymerase III subunit alpha n=1 Tax=Granulicatella elegans ATCC 700633 TaxID=626369 RepID=D0BKV5_9LACT|nr:DNA polymerase III subunit alpha [Granulicatella elegans]EEW93708.1 DNA polymerase III, alpha subunit [Granulicatella elegans ATCC 700633]
MTFTILQVTSGYSLLRSTIDLYRYVMTAKELGYQKLALTDEGVLHGAIEFYNLCRNQNIEPIIGCLFQYKQWRNAEAFSSMIVYAKDEIGYQSLIELSTQYQKSKLVSKDMEKIIKEASEHLQIVFPQENSEWALECSNGEVAFQRWLFEAEERYFPNIHLGIESNQILPIPLEELEAWGQDFSMKLLPFVKTFYLKAEDDFSYRVLKAIGDGETLSTTQAEVSGQYYLQDEKTLTQQSSTILEGKLVRQLEEFVDSLKWKLSKHKLLLPKFQTPEGKMSQEYLQEICQQSLKDKELVKDEYESRLNYELSIIHQMGFDDYFLIVWDIMKYAHEAGIQTGPGRGSAAGSLVSYLLNITKVDPIEYQLLFERFLNPERYTMPDIDLDFPDNRREDILDYVRRKYGENHVAQIATFGTFGSKQALRDVCRVLGLTTVQAGEWSKAIPNQLGINLKTAYEQSKNLQTLVSRSPKNQLIFETACRIEGLPRHLSTHAAGVVLYDKPLTDVIPLIYKDQQMPITQYTMKYVEQIGLLKMDFLGLTNLSILHDSIELTKSIYQHEIILNEIPLDDEKTLELFQMADTNGIFQFESDGIRRVLKKLRPTNLEDIAAVNALYRPGPMEQIDTFIKRKHGQEVVKYPHPILESILQSTYGVMVYQEQVMQVTSQMAGFTLGQADILRRAIGKKDAKVIETEKAHFIEGAIGKGIDVASATEVYQYIERFANYGFNRSHAFAYSLLAYQLAYFKAHYPRAFYTAILRFVGDRSPKLQTYFIEAKQRGISIKNPSINTSVDDYTATIDGIFIGLNAIKGLRRDFIQEILTQRKQNGPFIDFMDFAFRIGKRYCKKEVLEALIDAGAFDELGKNRATLRATIDAVIESVKFHGSNIALELNEEMYPKYFEEEDSNIIEKIEREIAVLGFPVSAFPTEPYEILYKEQKANRISTIYESKLVSVLGILKNIRKTRTKKGEPMAFGTIQDETGEIDFVVFFEVYPIVFSLLEENQLVLLKGKSRKNLQSKWQVQVQEVLSLLEVEGLAQATSIKCYIKITEKLQTKEVFDQIRNVIINNPGDTTVLLYIESKDQLLKMNFNSGLAVDAETIKALSSIVGEKNVKIIK